MNSKSLCAFVTVLVMVLGATENKGWAGLNFIPDKAFNVTTSTSVIASPFAGMNYDEVVNEINVLARYIPFGNTLKAFRFSGNDSSFGTFLAFLSYNTSPNFPDITQDQINGASYFLQDQTTRIVINPRPFARGPTTDPDYIINTTGASGITFDEQTGKLLILLYTTAGNGGQSIMALLPSEWVIFA